MCIDEFEHANYLELVHRDSDSRTLTGAKTHAPKAKPELKYYSIMATKMRLLVSHQQPAPNFFQQHAASLFSYLHIISIVLQNLVLLGC